MLTKKIEKETPFTLSFLLKRIFFFPAFIFNKTYTLIFNEKEIDEYSLRIVDKQYRSQELYLLIQIINSRATFKIALSEIFMNKNILYRLDPLQIPNIGYLLKEEELKKVNRLRKGIELNKRNQKNDYGFLRKSIKSVKIRNKIADKTFLYKIKNYELKGNSLLVSLIITSLNSIFEVPARDLIRDFNLLKNIDVADLIQFGYYLKELEPNITLDIKII